MSRPLLTKGAVRCVYFIFPSSLNFLYISSVLDDVPVDDLVSHFLVYEAPQVEILTSFCLGSDHKAVVVEGVTRQMLLRMTR